MKGKLVRYQKAGALHFITLSCFRRQPLLNATAAYMCFEHELEIVRRQYEFVVPRYVLMPEHVHLQVGETRIASLAVALQVLKQQTSRELKMWTIILRAFQVACLPFLCGASLICAQLQQPTRGAVKGELDYPNGAPAKGFMVSVIGTSRTRTNGVETMTDEKGNFSAPNLGFGSYILAPYFNSADTRYPAGTGQFFDKHLVRFAVSPDQPTATVKVQLDPPALIISGDAFDKVSGEPVAVQIKMWQIEDPENKWAKFASSAAGKYHCWLPAGKAIVLRASAEGYQDFESTIPAITNGVDPVVDIAMVPKKDAKEH